LEAHIDVFAEVARCYGRSVTAKAIHHFIDRTVKPDVKLILNTLAAGGNPEEVQLSGIAKIGGAKSGNGQNYWKLLKHTARLHSIYFLKVLSSWHTY